MKKIYVMRTNDERLIKLDYTNNRRISKILVFSVIFVISKNAMYLSFFLSNKFEALFRDYIDGWMFFPKVPTDCLILSFHREWRWTHQWLNTYSQRKEPNDQPLCWNSKFFEYFLFFFLSISFWVFEYSAKFELPFPFVPEIFLMRHR